jgi:hypothetical protein
MKNVPKPSKNMIATAKVRVVRALFERAEEMLDTTANRPDEDVPVSVPPNFQTTFQTRKLHFLLAQSGDPDSHEYLAKLDLAADNLSQKAKN